MVRPDGALVDRPAFISTFVGGLLAAPLAAEAQPARKVWRIGVLSTADGPEWEAFRQGLRTLGYVEGRNLVIDYRWHAGKFDRLPALAAELVALHVALIVTSAPQPTRAAKEATSPIPIVFVSVGDPVRLGLVESLARPGGNITGFQTIVHGGIGGVRLGAVESDSDGPNEPNREVVRMDKRQWHLPDLLEMLGQDPRVHQNPGGRLHGRLARLDAWGRAI